MNTTNVIRISFTCVALTCGCLRQSCPEVEIQADKAEIVVSSETSRVALFAAEEINRVLERAFGKRLPLVGKPTPGQTSIILGDCAESRAAGINVSALARDAFVILAGDGRVFIAGRDDPKQDLFAEIKRGYVGEGERATLFGAYEFLERYAGVRFYFPGDIGTVVLKMRKFHVASGRISIEPVFTVRKIYLQGDGQVPDEKNLSDRASWKALDSCRLRLETRSIPCCHGQRGFTFPERFHKTHPEYFALLKRDGDVPKRAVSEHLRSDNDSQMCHTSGIWEEIYRDCKAYLSGMPASTRGVRNKKSKDGFGWNENCNGRFVDVMAQDGMEECLCESCQKAFDKKSRQWATELVWGNTARLARRLQGDGLDGIVTQMAYPPYRDIPKCTLPSNIWVMVSEMGPWAEACPGEPETEIDEVRRWTEKLGHKIWMWTYPSKFGRKETPGVPDMAPRAWAKYYKRTIPYSYGAFCETEGEKSIFHYLNYYVFSRIAWDANVDVEALLDEHFKKMFGLAAPEMAHFYDELEEKWTKEVLYQWHDGRFGKDYRVSSDIRLWREIYPTSVIKKWSLLFDKAESKLSDDLESLRRVRFIRREFLDHLQSFGEKFAKDSDPELGRRRYRALSPGKNLIPRQSTPCHLIATNSSKSVNFTFPLAGKLKPNTRYRASAVFKLKDVTPAAPLYHGGCWLEGYVGKWLTFPQRTSLFSGTFDWIYQAYEFTTPVQMEFKVKPFFGFTLGRAVGEAWVECLALEELGTTGGPESHEVNGQ